MRVVRGMWFTVGGWRGRVVRVGCFLIVSLLPATGLADARVRRYFWFMCGDCAGIFRQKQIRPITFPPLKRLFLAG